LPGKQVVRQEPGGLSCASLPKHGRSHEGRAASRSSGKGAAGFQVDLGKPLVFDFVGQFLPDDFDEVQRIFSRKGAYRRFKDLLVRRSTLDQWYGFESKAEESALRRWCDLNSIEVSDEN
jgi:hypothetical protein